MPTGNIILLKIYRRSTAFHIRKASKIEQIRTYRETRTVSQTKTKLSKVNVYGDVLVCCGIKWFQPNDSYGVVFVVVAADDGFVIPLADAMLNLACIFVGCYCSRISHPLRFGIFDFVEFVGERPNVKLCSNLYDSFVLHPQILLVRTK